MLTINTEHLPLARFDFTGTPTLAEHKQMLAVWEQLFAQQTKFVALRVFHDELSLRPPVEIGQTTLEWLGNGARDKIKTWVQAIIIVVPESAYEGNKNKSVERVFGVPGGIFVSTEDAQTWLTQNLKTTMTLHSDKG